MPNIRGSKFREDFDKIEMIESPFKEEILRINEELKQLNLEYDRFHKQLFGGLKGLLYRDRTKILSKQDLISKYKLEYFYKQLKKDTKLFDEFQHYSIRTNGDKIDSAEICELYDFLEDRLFAAMCFVEMIAKYKNSNCETNELYQRMDQIGPFAFEHMLLFSTETLFMYIENPQIKELGKKMYDEYMQKKEEAKRINEQITELEGNIQDKISSSSKKTLTVEQLREYKDLLEGANNLLSSSSELSNHNNHQK